MKRILFLAPLMALAACEGSIVDAVGEAASSSSSSFSDGSPIGASDSNPGAFEGITLAGPDNIVFTTADEFSIRAEGDRTVTLQDFWRRDQNRPGKQELVLGR